MMLGLRQPKLTKLGKHRGWAAICFGDAGLELTTARTAGTVVSVETQEVAPFPAEVPANETSARWQAAVQTLRARIEPQDYRIVMAISCDDVLCQTLRLPATQPAELKQMLELQIDNLTPLPVDEVVYSFEPLETTETETHLLLAVARKAAVNERVAALEAVGLQPEVVGVDALAVFRDLMRQGRLPQDERVNALVLVGAGAANIIVHSKGRLVAVRSLVLDANALATGEAQAALREELQRTLVAAEVENPAVETGVLTFATWSESLRPLVEELARGWGEQAQFLTNGAVPTRAGSLCIETAQAGSVALNLLPDEWRERRRAARLRKLLVRGVIVLLAVYVLGLLVFLSAMGVRQSRLNRLNSEIAGLQGEFKDSRDLHKTLVAMQKQLDTKYAPLEVLRAVAMLLPESVKLSGFSFKKDESVTLRAQAQSASVATDFISRLEKSELFSKVATGSMKSDPGSGLTKFDAVCTLKSAAPAPITGSYGAK